MDIDVYAEFSLTINHFTWIIQLVNKAPIELPKYDVNLGLTVPSTLYIFLVHPLSRGNLEYVVRHELTHALLWSYGLWQVKLTTEVLCDIMAMHSVELTKLSTICLRKLKL